MIYWYDTEFDESGPEIKPISIGIVAEDGREYYAEFSEFDETTVNDFVKKNVLPKLGAKQQRKTKAVIAKEVKDFLGEYPRMVAYVADYDHVVFAKLWGSMADYPKGYPHYTWDVKQKMEDLGIDKLPDHDNKGEHNALADAKWLKEKAMPFLFEKYKVSIPENKKKPKEVNSMIGIKYQLFLLHPKAEKKDLLSAVEPAFDSPSAIDIITNTVKFSDDQPVIVIGPGDQLALFVKQVERLDSTEWLDLDLEARKKILMATAEASGLTATTDLKGRNEAPVLGGEVVAAPRRFSYPIDLPPGNRELWDAIRQSDDWKKTIVPDAKRHGYATNPVLMLAVYTNTYEVLCQNNGRIPWSRVSETDLKDDRWALQGAIIRGEEKAVKIIDKLEDHLKHAGMLRKSSAQSYDEVKRHSDNRYAMIHRITWTTSPEANWKQFKSFIVRETGKMYAFHEAKDRLSTKDGLENFTEIEITNAGEHQVMVFIKQYLTHHQAGQLTSQSDETKIQKTLEKYMRNWYTSGKFPDLRT